MPYHLRLLSKPGSQWSQAMSISRTGYAAGVFGPSHAEPTAHAAIWNTTGGLHFTDTHQQGRLEGVNSAGDAAGYRVDEFGDRYPILARNNVVHNLTSAIGGKGYALGINDNGLICGRNSSLAKGFVYDANTEAVVKWFDYGVGAINSHGWVVGGSWFDDGTMKQLAGGKYAYALGLNDEGFACGLIDLSASGDNRPAIWDCRETPPICKELPLPSGYRSGMALAINNRGEVVGSCTPEVFLPYPEHPYPMAQKSSFIYRPRTGTSADLKTQVSDQNFVPWLPTAINDAGEIAGISMYKTSDVTYPNTGFVLRPVPILSGPDFPYPTFVLPELVGAILGGVAQGGSGWIWLPGSGPRPVDPRQLWDAWLGIEPAKRDALLTLTMDEVAMYISDREIRERLRTALITGGQASLGHLLESAAEGRMAPADGHALGADPSRVQSTMHKVMAQLLTKYPPRLAEILAPDIRLTGQNPGSVE